MGGWSGCSGWKRVEVVAHRQGARVGSTLIGMPSRQPSLLSLRTGGRLNNACVQNRPSLLIRLSLPSLQNSCDNTITISPFPPAFLRQSVRQKGAVILFIRFQRFRATYHFHHCLYFSDQLRRTLFCPVPSLPCCDEVGEQEEKDSPWHEVHSTQYTVHSAIV